MRILYDEIVDALYLRLDESKIVESEALTPGVILDFDSKNQVVGIEVLNLKQQKKTGSPLSRG